MRCLVEMLKLRNTTFSISLHCKSEHAGLKNSREVRKRGEFCSKVKISRCYNFSIQETRNVLFQRSKEMCIVKFQRQEMTDILLKR